MVRINKYLADCGICSRREADKYIDSGKVKINGQIAKSGMQVDDKDIVEFDGKQIRSLESKVVLAYYKPIGVTCTEKDKHAKKTIVDAIKYPVRLTYAGRLDKDSEGLIIMTNDGELINNMMRGANRHEKEYIVKVDRTINPEFVEKMSKGVFLKDLSQTTRPCEVEIIGKNTFKIILTQGLNRQIRRMCQTLGYNVKSLKRIRVVNIELKNIRSGEYREIKGEELRNLYAKCGMNK
ncbi:MAG: rRNA pseudouridine synthase [Lachnospiraceae bacterium]|nr:rRNA pseudouridine synthase [Lachnospiraceae bacterium]MBQ2406600.1 rRNA pseudouridine synthase [Lachnospiraceae bacterium]